jgi:hypothetical protein
MKRALVVQLPLPLALALACLAGAATSCRSRSSTERAAAEAAAHEPPPLRIWVSNNGDIELDGQKVDLPRVTAAIEDAGKRNGEVLYGQDPIEGQPHPNIAKVFKVMLAAGVNFKFSLDRTFSQFSHGLNPESRAPAAGAPAAAAPPPLK